MSRSTPYTIYTLVNAPIENLRAAWVPRQRELNSALATVFQSGEYFPPNWRLIDWADMMERSKPPTVMPMGDQKASWHYACQFYRESSWYLQSGHHPFNIMMQASGECGEGGSTALWEAMLLNSDRTDAAPAQQPSEQRRLSGQRRLAAKTHGRIRAASHVDDVANSTTDSAHNRHMRTYLTACLYEKKGANWVPWQLDVAKPGASPHLQSDKCAKHAYHYAYSRYLAPLAERFINGELHSVKVLEIGLGCGQRNVGAGVRLWNALFANAPDGRKLTLHVLEFDARCARLWQARFANEFTNVMLTIFTGDQSNATTLEDLAINGGGEYDAIVDDGGHSMNQMQMSLHHLFKLVKPGGWYAIEDLQTSYDSHYGGISHGRRGRASSGNQTATTELIGHMIGWMSGDPTELAAWQYTYGKVSRLTFEHVMHDLEHVDCYSEICVMSRYTK